MAQEVKADEAPPVIKLEITLSNGHYESSLNVPLSEVAQLDERVADWLGMQIRYLRTLRPGEAVQVVVHQDGAP